MRLFLDRIGGVSGFRIRQKKATMKIGKGDWFICYMTKLSRWIGILNVEDGPFEDDTPIFYERDDPVVIRFRVIPIVWLEKEHAIPIHDDEVWCNLSFTQNHDKKSSTWTGKVRGSLGQLEEEDGKFLEQLILQQKGNKKIYPIDEVEYLKWVTHRIRRLDKDISVSVPEDHEERRQARESIQIQAMIAEIGAKMGLKIWLPRNDRARILNEMDEEGPPLLDRLPLNYDDTTLKTIEQIEVLWLKGRAIVRAFEVEHTTQIYSGILRKADLLALQPNMDIKLHIVAPSERRDKVFTEILRPVLRLNGQPGRNHRRGH
jgi:hypothetical protein